MAADWLLKVQEPDGNFIPIINPLSRKLVSNEVDWSRSGLASWALAEFSKITGNFGYLEASQKNFSYLKKHLLDNGDIIDGIPYSIITLAFLGETAVALDFRQESLEAGFGIVKMAPLRKFEPTSYSQAAAFLASLSKFDSQFLAPALKFSKILEESFEDNLKNRRAMNLAGWAGLADVFLRLFEITNDFSYLLKAKKIADWLVYYQLDCGAFKLATDSNFIYSRGTAKSAEILAQIFTSSDKQIDSVLDKVYYKKSLEKAFDWLFKMQYSAENSYFIPERNNDFVLGGFRHDYFNSDLWIDSAGHFLLGASRFLKGSQ